MKFIFTILFTALLLNVSAQKKETIKVSNTAELQKALDNAFPGLTIKLSEGIYTGQFKTKPNVNGTKQLPIIVEGSSKTSLQTGSYSKGYALQLEGNAYWVLKGFTINDSKKGIMIDHCNNITLDKLTVQNIGEEAIHFRKFSCYNTMQNCTVLRTGLLRAGYGEGCYIGTAKSNWEKYTNNQPDTSNYNRIINNTFGPDITAEHIDIKEGTVGGYIAGNTFNGAGMKTENSSDSWMDIKGCDNIIENNTGNNAILDGFQVHIPVEGAGARNVFRNNTCNVNAAGFAFNIKLLNNTDNGNIVYDNNIVNNAAAGVSNIKVTKSK